MGIYQYALNKLPRPLLIRASYLFRQVAPILFPGNAVECPVCERSFGRFLSYGSKVAHRPNVLCPHCLSLERHRLLWLFLKQRTNFFSEPLRILHIAPEQCFYHRFKSAENLDYVTGDLVSPLAQYHFDLHEIPFKEADFDVVICNHVLEHVEDDRRCMREIYRVLKPGGWAIMQVPIDYNRAATFEDKNIISPEDREKYYWQKDHVRLFGRDYPDRLTEAGFDVRREDFALSLGAQMADRYRLQKEEIIYWAKKKKSHL